MSDNLGVLNSAPDDINKDPTTEKVAYWSAKRLQLIYLMFGFAIVLVFLALGIILTGSVRHATGKPVIEVESALVFLVVFTPGINGFRLKKKYLQFKGITQGDIEEYVEMKKSGAA